jgi:acylphosphatase
MRWNSFGKLDAPRGVRVERPRTVRVLQTENIMRGTKLRLKKRQKDAFALAAPLLELRVCRPGTNPVAHDDQSSRRFHVSGTVQGVGYRYFVQRAAQLLHLAGYVRNLNDGRVEVYAIGSPESLATLRKELERGPRAAYVSSVIEEEASSDSRYGHNFTIEYDA